MPAFDNIIKSLTSLKQLGVNIPDNYIADVEKIKTNVAKKHNLKLPETNQIDGVKQGAEGAGKKQVPSWSAVSPALDEFSDYPNGDPNIVGKLSGDKQTNESKRQAYGTIQISRTYLREHPNGKFTEYRVITNNVSSEQNKPFHPNRQIPQQNITNTW
jgi:hypothetical protein